MLQLSNTLRVLEHFFLEPSKKQYLLDISRRIGLAHTSVKKTLVRLAKENLILVSIEKKGTRKFPVYSANLSDKNFRDYKKLYNIQSLEASGLIGYIEEKITPKCVVVFGSYAKGEDVEESDIDLFLECKEVKTERAHFEKKLKRKIELHFNQDFTKYPKELKNNIINGLVIRGYLEGYK